MQIVPTKTGIYRLTITSDKLFNITGDVSLPDCSGGFVTANRIVGVNNIATFKITIYPGSIVLFDITSADTTVARIPIKYTVELVAQLN